MSSLDAELKKDLMAELKSLQSALDATTVYITHDRVEALAVGQPHRDDEERQDHANRYTSVTARGAGGQSDDVRLVRSQ